VIALALLAAAVLIMLGVGGLVVRPTAMTGFVAFVRDSRPYRNEPQASGNADIYVVQSDGSGLRNLTDTPTANEMAPVWSPDGTRIAFIRSGSAGLFNGVSSLIIADSSTGHDQSTTEIDPGLTPWWVQWSPNGRSVMVSSLEGGSFLAVSTAMVDASTGRSRMVVRGAHGPAHWSPDGNWLLVSTGDLFLVPVELVGDQEIRDPSGLPGVRRLTFDERDEGYNAWAPDGSAVAFTSLGDAGMNESRVELVNVATGDRSILVEGAFSPAWAPDGRLIAYLKDGPNVWVASPGGSAARRVGSSFIPPKWSPDGAVLYLLDEGGLYSARPDGSGVRRLTPAEFKPEADVVLWLKGLEQSGGSNGCCGDFGPDWNPAMP
jgi:TolB protein